MPRVTCAACGAPSVLGASRCPKCLAPFGGESPTSGVVLVEPPPRAAGGADARRWRSLALGALGLLGIGALVWSVRGRGTADGPTASTPTEPSRPPVSPSPASPSVDSTSAADSTRAAMPSDIAQSPVAPETTTAPLPSASSRTVSPAAVVDAGDPGMTFTYETMTWVRVRSAPTVEAEVLATLPPGTRVEVAAIGRGWLSIRWEDRMAWVGASLVTRVR